VSRYAAICLPPTVSAAAIEERSRAAMALAGRFTGAVSGHRIEVEFDAAHLAAAAAVVPTVEQLDVRRVGFDAATMTEAMKAFKVVTAIASGAVEGNYG
jgi:D-amino peptidase